MSHHLETAYGVRDRVFNGALACIPMAYLVSTFRPLSLESWNNSNWFTLAGVVLSFVVLVTVVKSALDNGWETIWDEDLTGRCWKAVGLIATGVVLALLSDHFAGWFAWALGYLNL